MHPLDEAHRHHAMLRDIDRARASYDCPVCAPDPLFAFAVIAALVGAFAVCAALLMCPGVADAAWSYFGGGR